MNNFSLKIGFEWPIVFDNPIEYTLNIILPHTKSYHHTINAL